MMKMTKSSKWAKLRLLLSIPVISYALLSFSGPVHSNFTVTDYTSAAEFYSTLNKVELQKKDSVFFNVDEMPVFSLGGDAGLMKYISENVVFPEKGKEEGIQAKIYLGFVVNKKGKIQDVKIKRIKAEKPNKRGKMKSCKAPEFEAEALRVIKSLPSFTPGKNKGKPVNVGYTIPINFKLD